MARKVQFGLATTAGRRYGPVNQDVAFHAELRLGAGDNGHKMTAWGVFDGHGPLGGQMAELARQEVEAWREKEVIDEESLEEAFSRAHRRTIELSQNPPTSVEYVFEGKPAKFELTTKKYSSRGYIYKSEWTPVGSGTTATIATFVEHANKILLANVGDSEAHIVTLNDDDELEMRRVSVNHNPTDKSERDRLSSFSSLNFVMGEDKGYVELSDTPFKDGREKYLYQLSLTRAIGHELLAPHGVTWKPSIVSIPVDDSLQMLVIGSDGLWDNLSTDDVLGIIRDHEYAQNAAEALIEQIESLSIFDAGMDNTTVAIMYM